MVTLTTDFGWSEYVGTMKGVIYSVCPRVRVVDITHDIREFDVRHAAYVLHTSAGYFPPGTVHCVVVDPGVGTERRGAIVRDGRYTYVGPDNGVFHFLDVESAYHITMEPRSMTFHGRDVFAPVAAGLACGRSPEEFGTEAGEVERLDIGDAVAEEGAVRGEVICVDRFGNVITNIKRELLEIIGLMPGSQAGLGLGGREYEVRFQETYGHSRRGELICLVGSSGYLEIAVNQGDAGEMLRARGGEEVVISP
ncbi:MAG: SAM-dependent chlorinase/fluorinase [Euryarchaeota archaeon]|nr:SAM-dependent chlorinase/fluorinase [Euryarchaeota archaeon]